MKKINIKNILLLFFIILFSCNSSDNYLTVENALDAGRQFIDAVFKGDFKRADMLLLSDPKNKQLLKEKIEADFYKRSSMDKEELKQSSITVLNNEEVIKDSINIIKFINTYDNKPAVLKVVKQNKSWVIDLKYTFSGNL